jgi:hypothetical protein
MKMDGLENTLCSFGFERGVHHGSAEACTWLGSIGIHSHQLQAENERIRTGLINSKRRQLIGRLPVS